MNFPNWLNRSRPTSLLGVAVHADEVVMMTVRRVGGECRVERFRTLPLGAALWLESPQAAGQQLAQALKENGMTDKRCVVRLPLSWAMAAPIELPDLTGDDLNGFLELRAEREFAYVPGDAALAHHENSGEDNPLRCTLAAIAQRHLRAILQALEVAGRTPLSISIGAGICPDVANRSPRPTLNVCPTPNGVNLVITASQELLGFRHVESGAANEEEGHPLAPEELLREIRFTRGRAPAPVRDSLDSVRFHGPEGVAGELFRECESGLRDARWSEVERVPYRAVPTPDGPLPQNGEGALEAACRFLVGEDAHFEFLPTRISRAQSWINRYGKGKRRQTIIAGSALVAIVALAAFVHSRYLRSLENRWSAIQPRVEALEEIQQNIRGFRPWFDDDVPTLRLVEGVTKAFPEEGSLWAKTLEIKPGPVVTCSGLARNNQAILDTLDRLRQIPGVKGLKVRQVRGDNPIQFSFQFNWKNEPET